MIENHAKMRDSLETIILDTSQTRYFWRLQMFSYCCEHQWLFEKFLFVSQDLGVPHEAATD